MKKLLPLLIMWSLIIINGCASKKFVQTELYFGLSQQDGKIISDSAFRAFVQNYATKTFTQGFTITASKGWWTDKATKQILSEPSQVIITINKMNNQLSNKIDSLRSMYKNLFNQQSVLRTDKKVSVSF